MSSYRFRAALACKIVSLDRVKFNDAVAAGAYPCAPYATKGSARIFEEDDLLPLFFFARLTEFGVQSAKAGRLACEMAAAARDAHAAAASRIIYVHGAFSHGFMIPDRRKNPQTGEMEVLFDPDHESPSEKYPEGMSYPGNGRVVFTIDFYIKHVREMLASRIAYEASIIGEDD